MLDIIIKPKLDKIKKLPEEYDKNLLSGMKLAELYAKNQVKTIGFSGRPYLISRTGRLKNSIFSNVVKKGSKYVLGIGSDLDYAKRNHDLRPFIRGPMESKISNIRQIILDSIIN